MWTVDKLRSVIKERGEDLPQPESVAHALLAHERAHGRTEEAYDRRKARGEMERILTAMDEPFPAQSGREYPGMKQLRGVARQLEAKREQERAAVATTEVTVVTDQIFEQRHKVPVAHEDEDEHDEEYDR